MWDWGQGFALPNAPQVTLMPLRPWPSIWEPLVHISILTFFTSRLLHSPQQWVSTSPLHRNCSCLYHHELLRAKSINPSRLLLLSPCGMNTGLLLLLKPPLWLSHHSPLALLLPALWLPPFTVLRLILFPSPGRAVPLRSVLAPVYALSLHSVLGGFLRNPGLSSLCQWRETPHTRRHSPGLVGTQYSTDLTMYPIYSWRILISLSLVKAQWSRAFH